MAQTVVTSFYQSKKRFKDPGKSVKTLENQKLSNLLEEDTATTIELVKNKISKNSASVDPNKTQGAKVSASIELKKAKQVKTNTISETSRLQTAKKSTTSLPSKSKASKTSTNFLPSKSEAKKSSSHSKPSTSETAKSSTSSLSSISEAKKSRSHSKPSTSEIAKSSTSSLSLISEATKTSTKSQPSKSKPVKSKVAKNSSKAKAKHGNKVTNYLKAPASTNEITDVGDAVVAPKTADALEANKVETPRTPSKRNLLNSDESTPSKKRNLQRDVTTPIISPKAPLDATFTVSPAKADVTARRKLMMTSPSVSRIGSPRKIASPLKSSISPQKAASYGNLNDEELSSILNESRSKILFSTRLDELKKSLEKFSKLSSQIKDFQSNSCKITSVISSSKSGDDQPKPVIQGVPAFKKYSSLASPESLVLPFKYKVLGEAFRCTDTVVSMMHNRKEKISFEKLQSGVQKMIKKNFHLSHLGQILTVFPEAYSVQYEKCDSYIITKNSYELVITPKLNDMNGNSIASEEGSNKSQTTTPSVSFIQMTPQLLLLRKNTFFRNLTNLAKQQHKEFLKRINFPAVDDATIVRWHPKFNVDAVPDIPVALLPEEPESKVHTAKDVLCKIRGSFKGRIEKALKSVADEHEEANSKGSPVQSKSNTDTKKQSSALKGICSDLLEKIRARESAKLIETMTRSVEDEKRNAMIERLPKIVHIIWHYFIAERKSAVPVDAAIEKIIHSCNSLATPEAVNQHLQLITEVMPGWLSFIKIPKGVYITMDKTKDINDMIAAIK